MTEKEKGQDERVPQNMGKQLLRDFRRGNLREDAWAIPTGLKWLQGAVYAKDSRSGNDWQHQGVSSEDSVTKP